ncbi:hypothetical protein [Persicirhabdus sediminis]|uniref:Uncharacterized protein n=1 Tax=Persicirhabdus sediminis TaxID=454144 RepID=A0A8J7MDC3_9BACT|nr:hypothetical protein [Persicirhabdus sediminis]MBK1791327.1 hypothetical protein [Persicirhabdus sediminis]
MTSYPSIEQICRQPWLSGRIQLNEDATSIQLAKKTNILALMIWCLIITAGIIYVILKYTNETHLAVAAATILTIISATFLTLSISSNRQPSILVFDKNLQQLSSPQHQQLDIELSQLEIHLIPAWVSRHLKNNRQFCQILALYNIETKREIPIFCEPSLTLKTKAEQFAKRLDIPYQLQEKRTILAYQT